ncbi:uncharacterized protein LOC133907293 [Phragmites australis]|uniref:uncharacterized protein LOC133907293 n=1 Tax=Phragmites australis TaxID=29695 RepID=UPI002D76E66F|nr:uncharacterized protein LOC133907293 [Phragmites australis]
MPPPEPQHCGAADAGSSGGGMPPPKQHRRAEGITGSTSGGVSQRQHRAKEVAVGKGGLVHEETTPQKLRRGNEKAGTVSRGGGALLRNRKEEKAKIPSLLPSRMPATTTITQAQADGEKNTESNASAASSDFSLRKGQQFNALSSRCFASLDISNVDANAGPSMDAPHHNATAHDWRESAAKHCAKEKASMSSSGWKLQKHRAKQTGLNAEIPGKEKVHKGSILQMHQAKQEMGPSRLRRDLPGIRVRRAVGIATQLVTTGEKHTKSNKSLPRNSSLRTASQQLRTTSSSRRLDAKTCRSLDDNSTAQDCKESANENTVVHVTEGKDLQEANDAIQRLNDLGLGEDISGDEYYEYLMQLPRDPVVNPYIKLDDEQMTLLYARHARYYNRYKDFPEEIRRFGYFWKDDTLDWSFPPDLCRLPDLDDYQRLVPRNYAGCEYFNWDQYRMHFHSYEAELEYLSYYKELSEKLKWMEDYVLIEVPSLKWGKINTRGAYQAIKIATGFSKITPNLAYTGFNECEENLCFDAFWLKDLDGVYFEIWLRVTKQKKSFRDALEEVYKLDKFPFRQNRMKYALDNDFSDMETEFHTCTASITSDVAEDKAHELIIEAVKKLKERPKFYEHYIRKKIAIAQAIGLIPTVEQASAESGQQVDV